jgi:hypothetical protein
VTQLERPDRPLRSQPSYDTSWQREHDDFGTSEDEYDFGQEEEEERDEVPGSAISVVEEGRGLIVHGEGASVHSLHIQSGQKIIPLFSSLWFLDSIQNYWY